MMPGASSISQYKLVQSCGFRNMASRTQPVLLVVVLGGPILVPVPVVDVVPVLVADDGHSIMNVELVPVPATTVTLLLG